MSTLSGRSTPADGWLAGWAMGRSERIRRRAQRRLGRALTAAVGGPPLLRPGAGWLWVLSAGAFGSLTVSGARGRRAARRVARVALAEGRARDRFVVEPRSRADLVSGYVAREEARLSGLVDTALGRLEQRSLAGPPVARSSRLLVVGLVAIVLGIDTVLNVALVERLAGVASVVAWLSSVAVSLLLLAVSHLTVADAPSGQRARLRRRLVIALLVGFAVFVVTGGYLRTHSSRGSSGGSLGLSGQDRSGGLLSWTDLAGPAAGYLTMLALLVTTFAVAALAGLHHEHLRDRTVAADNGRWTRQIVARRDHVIRSGAGAASAVRALGGQLAAVQDANYRLALPPDAADRLDG